MLISFASFDWVVSPPGVCHWGSTSGLMTHESAHLWANQLSLSMVAEYANYKLVSSLPPHMILKMTRT